MAGDADDAEPGSVGQPPALPPAGSEPEQAPQPEAAGPDEARWAANIAAAAIIAFSLTWVALAYLGEHGLYGPPSRALEVNLYRDYAGKMLSGLVPYRDFAFEYPPLALVPILGPLLMVGDNLREPGYRQAFGVVAAAIGMLTMVFVMRAAVALELRRRDMVAAAILVATSPILMGPLMLARLDLWPALFAAAAVWLFVTDRHRLAAVALGLGVLAKVYPIVLGPFLVVHLWRRQGPAPAVIFAVIVGAVVLAGVAPFLLIAPDGVIEAFRRAIVRPLQIEAIGAAILFLLNIRTGARLVHTFDSYNLSGSLATQVSTAQTAALALVLLATLVLFLRGRPTLDRLMLACGAALCAWVAFGKVLSPQYLMWLIAPLAVIRARGWSPHLIALGAAVLLTGLYYPRFYSAYLYARELPWVAVVLGRDVILIAITLYLVARLIPRRNAESADIDSPAVPATGASPA